MKRIKNVAIVSVLLVLSGLFVYSTSRKIVVTEKREVVSLPLEIDFSGEKTPLHIADVRERLDREMVINTNLHSSTTLILKRANRAFPVIEPILKKYGVPDDFKYLAVIESGLANVVSPAGARGVWQFMPQTAKEQGMEVNDYVDERYHLEKSTEAACRYLLEAKNKFGNWTLAAASYNAGMGGINKQLTNQQVSDYYDVLLTEETSRYVFRILALKEIMLNPAKYGFEIPNEQLYHPIEVKKIEVDSTITDLATFAKDQGINYKILKLHNPWLRDKKLENKSKKVYTLEIPTEGY
ncbi:lytic transglycosylase domain-containing protein [Flavobacterium piscinae]|uniref:Lytic transglycosylase domain-containing protein n=1 Tax=Flavobacterium piscinae TaxID=2506424 RepID=A0A4Q1KIH7_9FLAO|nr:lytic transglycosylase domain-containing protein [Flavobacterium piscinae]RXR29115.1 lytic transglycosylase domain-containing protein [Flavobacterium piscinae]